jgi:hypothetical protein
MTADRHLPFIKKRIMESGQAIVYRYIDETHKQAMGIKKNLVVDDSAKLYIPVAEDFEQLYSDDIFPVELFFYKKGNAFYMTAKGTAVKSADQKSNEEKMYCVKMNEIEYCELPGVMHESIWAKCMKFFTNISLSYNHHMAIQPE